jgi:hypothetical protein
MDAIRQTEQESKQDKVWRYLQVHKMDQVQRYMLYKQRYPKVTEYDDEILAYVQLQDLDPELEKALLRKLGFRVDMNGNVIKKEE